MPFEWKSELSETGMQYFVGGGTKLNFLTFAEDTEYNPKVTVLTSRVEANWKWRNYPSSIDPITGTPQSNTPKPPYAQKTSILEVMTIMNEQNASVDMFHRAFSSLQSRKYRSESEDSTDTLEAHTEHKQHNPSLKHVSSYIHSSYPL